MSEVSQDFRRSMSMLHQQVQALVKDNAALRAEMDELKKMVQKSDEVSVKKKDDIVKRAVLSGDYDKIAALSTGANTIVQDELLRLAALSSPNPGYHHPRPNETLLAALIAAKEDGTQMPGSDVVIVPERGPSRTEEIVAQLEQTSRLAAQQDKARREAERLAQIEASRPKQSENALRRLSPRWRGAMDGYPNEDF